MSDRERWREHNESFRYKPPETDVELWDSDDIEEMVDRVISDGRRGWECQMCDQPMSSLSQARSHVQGQHWDELVNMVTRRQDSD